MDEMTIARTIAVSLFVFLLSCTTASDPGGGGEIEGQTGAVDRILLTPSPVILRVGSHLLIQATLLDARGEPIPDGVVSWSSDDPAVATIDAEGTVVAIGVGTATITARSAGREATAAVEVAPAFSIGAADVEMHGQVARLTVDERAQFSAIAFDDDGLEVTTGVFSWASEDDAVATVSDSGEVLAVGPGSTRIHATAGEYTASIAVSVVLRFESVAVGDAHSCALTPAGKAWCWGSNQDGRLGISKRSDGAFPTPMRVSGDHTFTQLALGSSHGCGLDDEGRAWCWGLGEDYSLGGPDANEVARRPKLVEIPEAVALTTLAAGRAATCGISTEGELYCWGRARANRPPGRIWASVDASFSRLSISKDDERFICAIDTEQRLWCGGRNDSGQIQSPASGAIPTPIVVDGAYDVVSEIATGLDHSCAVAHYPEGDRTACWGAGSLGQVGDSAYPDTADQTILGVRATGISAGASFTCGIVEGTGWCWGANDLGQLGADPFELSRSAAAVEAFPLPVRQIVAGTGHSCALSDEEDPKVYCWGDQLQGLLGNGSVEGESSPPTLVRGQVHAL